MDSEYFAEMASYCDCSICQLIQFIYIYIYNYIQIYSREIKKN